MSRILHLSCHADDQSLGCGGTLLAHKANGDEIFWAIATTPNVHGAAVWPIADVLKNLSERDAVAYAFGFVQRYEFHFPAATLDLTPTTHLVEQIRTTIRLAEPDVIYTVAEDDRHSDHRALARALAGALPLHDRLGVQALYECETISASQWFHPTVWRDVTPYFARKLEIAALYQSEMGKGPRTPEGIEAWGRFRGEQIGVRYAEAFRLVWGVES